MYVTPRPLVLALRMLWGLVDVLQQRRGHLAVGPCPTAGEAWCPVLLLVSLTACPGRLLTVFLSAPHFRVARLLCRVLVLLYATRLLSHWPLPVLGSTWAWSGTQLCHTGAPPVVWGLL